MRLPEPRIETLQLDALGNVIGATFADGQVLEDPLAEIKDLSEIDLQGLQVSMPYDVMILRGSDGIIYRCHKRLNTDCYREFTPDYLTLVLDEAGDIAQMLDAQGKEVVPERFNLDDTDIENVSVQEIRSYRVIEYRNRSTGEPVRQIVQLSLVP